MRLASRHRRVGSRHAALMIAMAAVTSGAIWLRLTMVAVNAAELPFDQAYAVAAWACWLVPLALAVTLARRIVRFGD